MTSADSDAEFIYKITQQNNLLMNVVTAFSKYRVSSLGDLKYLEEIHKIKAIELNIKKITKSAETGR